MPAKHDRCGHASKDCRRRPQTGWRRQVSVEAAQSLDQRWNDFDLGGAVVLMVQTA